MRDYTIKEASKEVGKSVPWLRNAIKLGLVRVERVGHYIFLSQEEVTRLKRAPFEISNEELRRHAYTVDNT
jgi:hypothetical protein